VSDPLSVLHSSSLADSGSWSGAMPASVLAFLGWLISAWP
jgi:hypothetical protein